MALSPDIKEAVERAWGHAPDELKQYLGSGELRPQIEALCGEFALAGDAINDAHLEALLVLLGLDEENGLANNLGQYEAIQKLEGGPSALAEKIRNEIFAQHSPAPPYEPEVERAKGSTSPLEQFVKKDAEVQARFEKLPEGVRNEILSPAVAASFSTLVREHALEQEAFMTFGAHVVRVLTGLENVNDLRTALRDKKIVAHEEVEPFAQQVEAGMVKPVRDAIVKEVGKRKEGK